MKLVRTIGQKFLQAGRRVRAVERSKRVVAGGLAVVLLATIAFPLIDKATVSALSTYTQNDWSGGVGTDPSSQYSEATNMDAGATLAIGNQVNADWCNTAKCNSSWTRRKLFTATNLDNGFLASTAFRITIPYDAAMQNDFDDIRFVSQDGAYDVGFYLNAKTDGVSAEYVVSPTNIYSGANNMYVYFGNGAASTGSAKSSLLFQDNFASAGTPAATRIDANIDFALNGTSPITGVGADNWSVRWTGKITIPADDNYTFYISSDDGNRMFVDGNPLFGSWGGPTSTAQIISLTAGEHDIRIEYQQQSGPGYAQLRWSSNAISIETVPSSVLTAVDPDTSNTVQGLLGTYYNDANLGTGLPSPWQWYQWDDPARFSITGDTATLYDGASFNAMNGLDDSKDAVVEFDLQVAPGDCNSSNYAGYKLIFGVDIGCDDGNYFHISGPQGTSYNWDQLRATHFQLDTWYRFRMVRYGSQSGYGADLTYSSNGGLTYQTIPGLSRSFGYSVNQSISFSGGGRQSKLRSIIAYSYTHRVIVSSLGLTEFNGGGVGRLTSAIVDFDEHPYFGNVIYNTSGTGISGIRVRTSASDSMAGAKDFNDCPLLASGDAITATACVALNERYVQYQIILSDEATPDISVNSVSIEYSNDTNAPGVPSGLTIKKSSSGPVVAPDGWVRLKPYVSWTAATDADSGIAGYCVYVGTQEDPGSLGEQGVLGSDALNNYIVGDCGFSTRNTYLDLAQAAPGNMTSGERYYVRIAAVDNAGNAQSDPLITTSFRFDDEEPDGMVFYNTPGTVQNSKIFTTAWTIVPGLLEAVDEHSGIAGAKYCVAKVDENFAGCDEDDMNWYGANHTSGDLRDTSDVLPMSAQGFTTVAADAARLDDGTTGGSGVNGVLMAVVDNAGNVEGMASSAPYVVISVQAPSAPQNLQVTPSSSTSNNFSFTWDAPSSFSGSTPDINYCWTVNEPIEDDQSNCHWTGAGVTQLAAGPYATEQGVNTMRIVAKDQPGNFSAANVATVTFSASTTAPGAPTDMDLADVSTRATSSWKLASSWVAPSQPGSGIASYKIYRSTDNVSFTQVGTTSPSNLSFIDAGLSQITYYYYVRACDNANNCGVPSNVATKKPTGRFTSPANLTVSGQPKATNIGPKKATITWTTDRDSDSKVAIGTAPGQYAQQEIGNSAQQPDHQVDLTNLQPSTTYYYVTKWTDSDGNTGTSPEKSFTTLPAPNVGEVAITGVSVSGATISFSVTGASQARLSYGASESFGAVKTIDTAATTSTYSVNLDGLSDDTKFYFRIDLVDADGNLYIKDVQTFTTKARPKITNLRFQPVADAPSSTQQITWDTNVPATSRVSYGPQSTPPKDAVDSALVTQHSIVLTGLVDDTDYALQAISVNAEGISASSEVRTFKTALDTRPPKISEVVIESSVRGTGSEARGQVVVSWKTDELSTSQVGYGIGQTGALTNRTGEDNNLTTDHVVVLSDVQVSSIYHLQVFSADKARNISHSDNQTVVVGRASENVFTIIFNALESIFGRRN